ncbi:MAG: type II toxin-antitoxin system VapC family toxin [Chloroflexi bacterium]|nr:type II toxin-antitoxin system VapC family toxin [Chloroflexota bacterium]
MADLVVDSNAWVAAYLREDPNHGSAQRFFTEFREGLHICHLPRLVLIEVCAAIIRQTQNRAFVMRSQQDFSGWEQRGLVNWYDLNAQRTGQAIGIATSYRLRGADSVVAALGDEINAAVLTFDAEILARYPNARRP